MKGKNKMTVEMEVKVEGRKQMQGTTVRKAVWAQEGRTSGRGSYHRTALGNRTNITAWGRSNNSTHNAEGILQFGEKFTLN
jgi:hypothetical protein